MDTSAIRMVNAYACARTHANPTENLIEQLLPFGMEHQKGKKAMLRILEITQSRSLHPHHPPLHCHHVHTAHQDQIHHHKQ